MSCKIMGYLAQNSISKYNCTYKPRMNNKTKVFINIKIYVYIYIHIHIKIIIFRGKFILIEFLFNDFLL